MSDRSPNPADSGTLSDRHARAAELLEAYVLDALEPSEAALVSDHLYTDDCLDCEEEVSALRRVVETIPLAIPLRETSSALKRRVMAVVPQQNRGVLRMVPLSVPLSLTTMAAAAAALVLAGLLAWNVVLQAHVDDLESDGAQVRSTLTETDDVVAQTQGLIADVDARTRAMLVSLTAPTTQWVSLAGTAMAPAAQGRMLWEPHAGVVLVVASGLEYSGGAGRYVVWVETANGPLSVGHFYVDESGTGIVQGHVDVPLTADTLISVSHEDDLEAEQPSSQPVLVRAP